MGNFQIIPQSKLLPDGAKLTTLRIQGDIDNTTVRALQDHLLDATAKNPTHLQFDLGAVTHISSAGIILFHTALQIQQRRGGTFALVNPRPKNESHHFETSDLQNDATLVKLAGNLDLQGASAIEQKFLEICRGNAPHVLVDLSAMDFMSSMGIRLLLQGLKLASAAGGRLLFLNPSTQILSSLEIAGFTPFIAHGAPEDVAANMK